MASDKLTLKNLAERIDVIVDRHNMLAVRVDQMVRTLDEAIIGFREEVDDELDDLVDDYVAQNQINDGTAKRLRWLEARCNTLDAHQELLRDGIIDQRKTIQGCLKWRAIRSLFFLAQTAAVAWLLARAYGGL